MNWGHKTTFKQFNLVATLHKLKIHVAASFPLLYGLMEYALDIF